MAYTLPNTILNGTTGDAGQVEANFLALLAAVNNSIAADGTIGPSAAINWNGQGLTGVGGLSAGSLSLSGNATIAGTLSVTGAATYGALTASSFSTTGAISSAGAITMGASGNGTVRLNSSTSTSTGYVEFINASGTRQGYIGFAATGGKIQYASDMGAGHEFQNPVLVDSTLNVSGTSTLASLSVGAISATGGITTSGALVAGAPSTISGNLTVANGDIKVYRTGGTTGAVYLENGINHYLYWDGTNYNLPSGNLVAGGNFSASGTGSFGGAISAPSATLPTINIASNWQIGIISGKLSFIYNGTVVASVDSSGNIIAKGNVTANGAP